MKSDIVKWVRSRRCKKVGWVCTDQQRMSNQVEDFAISGRFKGWLLYVHKEKDTDFGKDHIGMATWFCVRRFSQD